LLSARKLLAQIGADLVICPNLLIVKEKIMAIGLLEREFASNLADSEAVLFSAAQP